MPNKLTDNFLLQTGQPLDARYLTGALTAYADVAAANAAVPVALRHVGLKVLIGTTEYWWSGGVANENLVAVSTGGGGGITDGDKGDITVSSGGTSWTIDPQAVTFSKIQNIDGQSLIGRHANGSGEAQKVTVNGGLEFNGVDIRRAALTGVVTAAAGDSTTAIAEGALSIAMTSGLQTALDAKQATLVSGTNIKTINGNSILGSGNLSISAGSIEGTAVLSTGETGGLKFLREDGDGTCSWQLITGGGDALTSSPLSQFAATTSSQLAEVISDETGSGALVFATSPTLVTPALGTPSGGVLTNCTGTASGLTAGTVSDIGNLTGIVTSSNRATAIADAALSIAKTSGLQTALDGKLTAADADTANTPSKIVQRDGSGVINVGLVNATGGQSTLASTLTTGVTEYGNSATWSYGTGRAAVHREALQVFETIGFACSDMTTVLTTGEKIAFDMPFDFSVRRVYASLAVAPTVSALTVDVEDEGTSILNAVLSIATSANNAETSTFASAASSYALTKGNRITIDIDSVGSSNAGLILFFEGYRT